MKHNVIMNRSVPCIKIGGHVFEHYYSFENKKGINEDKFRHTKDAGLKIIIVSKTIPEYKYVIDDTFVNYSDLEHKLSKITLTDALTKGI